jgi:hypothetical protein
MPVIINDFEVVAEPPAAPAGPSSPGSSGTQGPARLGAQDLERLLEHLQARRLRVLAD